MACEIKYSKACCGNSDNITVFSDKPIKKEQVQIFIDSGYTVPPHYTNNSIFYARKETLTASASLGTRKFNIKVGNHRKQEQLDEFIRVLELAINS